MATIIKPPQTLSSIPKKPGVYLAGSIEMGKAVHWQRYFGNKMKSFNIVIWNPRRVSWDSSWKQAIDNLKFEEQVDRELDALEKADSTFFTLSPIRNPNKPDEIELVCQLWEISRILSGRVLAQRICRYSLQEI
jgi:hypothetical protein